MKHLVIGASGQVGWALFAELEQRGFDCFGTYNEKMPSDRTLFKLDITDDQSVSALVAKVKADCIYAAASYTNVDGCESDPDRSYAVNVQGLRSVAQAAVNTGARLIYFSSDYIFDGLSGPYDESCQPSPVNVYGRHKVMAEELLNDLLPGQNLIVRTTVVFGRDWQKKNFVLRLLEALGSGEELPVPEDQIGTPTYSMALAQSTIELVLAGKHGVYNVSGEELASRYDLALAVAREFDLPEDLIIPVKSNMLDQIALRPLRAGLQINKIRSELGVAARLTGFRQALKELHLDLEAEVEAEQGE